MKRGLFILDNILGTPPPPPPPDVPPLEDAAKGFHKTASRRLREVAGGAPRASRLCSSCHTRMDPLGLALENFNALGMWREKERGQPIDAAGKLITGETFHGHPRAEANPRDGAPPRFLPLPDREAADLRPGPRPGVLRRGDGGPDRGAARPRERPVLRPADGHHRIGPVPEASKSSCAGRPDRAQPAEQTRSSLETTAMKTNLARIHRRSTSRQPEPPPLPARPRRLRRAAGVRVAAAVAASSPPKPTPPARLATTATGAPLRMAFVYFPNGAIQPTWWPKAKARISN